MAGQATTNARGAAVAAAMAMLAGGAHRSRQHRIAAARAKANARVVLQATTVEAETETNLAPWEIDEETEEERQERYSREADEMKLKWDARRLEERESAQRRQAFAQKEKERASLYGPRDAIMEAYESRMYEEARVIEVRRKQREVFERIKAAKAGKPLPPKGTPYVELKPKPTCPPCPSDFDISGHYDPQEDIEARKYRAPESYVSPTGPAPPPRHLRGSPRAAWENPPYNPPPRNPAPQREWPEPGSLPASEIPPVRERIEKDRAERNARSKREEDAKEKDEKTEEAAKEMETKLDEQEPEEAAKEQAATPGAAANLPSAEEVKGMTVPQLKEALKSAGLPITGKKSELVDRLIEASTS
eukprot:TRINITY_DN41650_c0_g1_i1.p1 TRINITY_DN41650_c0_g1~~TRINITY_DN41650_c0_g1_i1.p1  ORF type:complete len:422 (-),score=101.13 TRINITY_DN41650_c0_g1_i1:171-1253(-)